MTQVDPHSIIRTTPLPCTVHLRHKPEPRVNHRHHVWPLGEGGPDIEDNLVVVCPTGHANIHDLLQFYRLHRGDPPYDVIRRYTHGERQIAKTGWTRMQRKSM